MKRINSTFIFLSIMAKRGINGSKLAKMVRRPASTVSYHIRHVDTLPISVLMEYAAVLGMSDAELLEILKTF